MSECNRIKELEATVERLIFERDRKDEMHKYVVQKLEAEYMALREASTEVVNDNNYVSDRKPGGFDSYGINGVKLWNLREELTKG